MLGSRVRRAFQLAPPRMRQRMLEGLPRVQTAAAVFGGRPSVAHAEALLRGTVFRGIELDEPVDALVIGIPPTTPFMPRERPNPVSAAYLGLGLALRLWRNMPPIVRRRHGDPRPSPSRAASHGRPRRPTARSSTTRVPPATSRRCVTPRRRRSGTRRRSRRTAPGSACHPLQPFVEWSACDASSHRLGAVLIAGCRDAQSARQLGFVPVHGLGAALEMARGRGAKRIGYLLAPPYVPLVVSS